MDGWLVLGIIMMLTCAFAAPAARTNLLGSDSTAGESTDGNRRSLIFMVFGTLIVSALCFALFSVTR